MSKKETDHKLKSLKMRYSRSKTMDISLTGSLEDLLEKFKPDTEKTADGTLEVPKRRMASLPIATEQIIQEYCVGLDEVCKTNNTPENVQKLTEEIKELNEALKQERDKNSENQQQILILQEKLDVHQEIMINQERQLETLNDKTKEKEKTINELLLTNKALKEKDEQFHELTDLFQKGENSIKELKAALMSSEEKVTQISITLEQQREKNFEKNEEIAFLTKSLTDASKMEKKLENFLSEETAKNKKLQDELEYVIQMYNDEKEELLDNFEEFKKATGVFLQNCDAHNKIMLHVVEEGNKHIHE